MELKHIAKRTYYNNSGCLAGPINQNDILKWQGIIRMDSPPYEGGVFLLNIVFPSTFPFFPPLITFTTPIYSPIVLWKDIEGSPKGKVQLNTLGPDYSPAFKILKHLQDIKYKLTNIDEDPNEDNLEPDIKT